MKQTTQVFVLFALLVSYCLCANRIVGENYLKVTHNHDGEVVQFLNEIGIVDNVDSEFVNCYISTSNLPQIQDRNLTYYLVDHAQEHYHEKFLVAPRDIPCCSDDYWAQYHNYDSMTQLLLEFQSDYPELCKLQTIGQSVRGRELWKLKISDNVNELEDGEPQFIYIGNMHGDEVVGREMLLRYIYHLLSNYNDDPDITELLDTTQIYIIPSMNPDGYELHQRANANGVDLNRDFPDRIEGLTHVSQPEVNAIIADTLSNHYVLSANLHGGSLVVNYPYDDNTYHISGQYSACPDDLLFREIAVAYSRYNEPMYQGEFEQGITNGADWYVLSGGMQDWNYEKTYSNFQVTIELSYVKWPSATLLSDFWSYNRESLSSYLQKVHQGVRGTVTSANGTKVQGTIRIEGINHDVITSQIDGWYYRPLAPGSYAAQCTSPAYPNIMLNQTFTVKENSPTVVHFQFE